MLSWPLWSTGQQKVLPAMQLLETRIDRQRQVARYMMVWLDRTGEQVGDIAAAAEDVAEDAVTAGGVAAGNGVASRALRGAGAGVGSHGGTEEDSEDGDALHFD